MDVRQLGPDDRELLRTIRLRALADAPFAFGSTLEREQAFTDADWDGRLAMCGGATFVAEGRDDATVGIVTGVADPGRPGLAELVGLWVDTTVRRAGVGNALVSRLLEWAREQDVRLVRLCVTEGNETAERLYLRHGFGRTDCAEVRTRDGLAEIGMELRLADGPG